MKYKVKITVIDKNFILNCNNNIAMTLIRVSVLAIMWEMNLYFTVMMKEMISGIWV